MNLAKPQIPRIRIQRIFPSSIFDLFGDNRSLCVFGALTSVDALFYLRGLYEKESYK